MLATLPNVTDGFGSAPASCAFSKTGVGGRQKRMWRGRSEEFDYIDGSSAGPCSWQAPLPTTPPLPKDTRGETTAVASLSGKGGPCFVGRRGAPATGINAGGTRHVRGYEESTRGASFSKFEAPRHCWPCVRAGKFSQNFPESS